MEELEATKEDLEIRIANEKIAKPKVTEDHLKSYFYRFRGMDMRIQKNRQMLIDSFINRIYLYDDGRLVIYCNHKDGAEKFIKAIKNLNAKMGIPEKLSGIKKEDIAIMAKHAEKEANPLYPVPKLMTKKELAEFYVQVADWSN